MAALWLLPAGCGANSDLVIGILLGGGGSGAASGAGSGGDPPIDMGGSGGAAGSAAAAGSSGTAGIAGSAGFGAEGGVPGTDGGAAGAAGTGDPGCIDGEEPPIGSLVHRYDFSGTGTTLTDLVGIANGTLQAGALLDGSGLLTLKHVAGQPDGYVDLGQGIVSALTDATFVVWVTYDSGGPGFQRIFDFGDSNNTSTDGVGQGDQGRDYIALIQGTNFANGNELGAQVAAPGSPTLSLGSFFELDSVVESQVALTYASGQRVALYADAIQQIASPVLRSLSEVHDVNCWLGRSQWQSNPGYRGTYNEFRIYNAALNSCQLATLKARGPDQP